MININSEVLTSVPYSINLKIAFDCRKFNDNPSLVVSSSQMFQPFEYDKPKQIFKSYVISPNGNNSVNGVLLTPYMLTPPIQNGVIAPNGAGNRNLFYSFEVDADGNNVLVIGLEPSIIGINEFLPDVIFMQFNYCYNPNLGKLAFS